MAEARHIAALDRVLELVVLLDKDMTESLAKEGLTPSRTTLLWLLRSNGPSTQRVLADGLGVSARTVTGLVDGLEATGFVTRQPHPTDRRAILVSFTERGAAVVAAMEQQQGGFADLLFGGMPEQRFECLYAGLGEIVDRLRAAGLTTTPHEEPS
ncbi:MarR family winged helix-turn-helix transcriptional regulator [Catellatospora sichuanensis]|uniref:MarR family winged helix-turn-helix transcriptional regulator n=1 Tax=Catellatospora sichuanensis TaxID=1969805 RepID=UPI001FE72DFE|nr:MarR family transcriptional regulator [Catellatospora sichuanensis]